MVRVGRRLAVLVALWVGVGGVVGVPARAADLQRCRFMIGTLAVSPGLTDLPAVQTITAHGRLTGCTAAGGSGTFGAVIATSRATCASLSTVLEPTNATFGWADGETSVAALTFPPLVGSPNKLAIKGTVISGAGRGTKVAAGLHLSVDVSSVGRVPAHHQHVRADIRRVRQLLDNKGSGCAATTPVGKIDVANDRGFEFNASPAEPVTNSAGRTLATRSRHAAVASATRVPSTPTTVRHPRPAFGPSRTVQPVPRARTKRSAAGINVNGSRGSSSVSFTDPVSLLAVGMVGGSVCGFVLLFVKRSTLMTRRMAVRRFRP
jgi:hypothetical protein